MDDSDVLDSWEDAADTGVRTHLTTRMSPIRFLVQELEKRMEERENELAKCLAFVDSARERADRV